MVMARKVIVSPALLRAMATERQANRPYTVEQGQRDAQVARRVQEFVRTQREGAEVLREHLGRPIVF